jgi:preprotein translocase subunit YajC
MTRFLPTFVLLATAATARAEGPAAGPGGLASFAPLAIIMVLFYFLLIRPQQKQAKDQQKMIDALKKGDRVLTSGGLYATVVALKGKALEVKLNDEVKVLLARSAVSQVVEGDPAAETPEVVPSK